MDNDEPTTDSVATLLGCYKSCMETVTHCLDMGGKHANAEHINLLLDCAKICSLAADFSARDSQNQAELHALCADICQQCADDCEKLADADTQMEECAQVCRECAEMCEAMA